MAGVNFPSQTEPSDTMEQIERAEAHRGIPNSRSTSYVVGNYDLVRSEVDKFKKSIEDSYDSLGILSLELDTNEKSLSSEEPDGRAGKATVYFSNRIQQVGFHLISKVVRTLHQTQAAALHRYPEYKCLLQQCITYGPVPNISCFDTISEKEQPPATLDSETTSVPKPRKKSETPPLESVPIDERDLVPEEDEADAPPNVEESSSAQEETEADPSSNSEVPDRNQDNKIDPIPSIEELDTIQDSKPDPIPSIEEPDPIQDNKIDSISSIEVPDPTQEIKVDSSSNVEVPIMCRPSVICSDSGVNSINIKPLSPLSTAEILECLNVDEECANTEFSSEPMLCSPKLPSLPKTVISVVENSDLSNRNTTENDSVEIETHDLSPSSVPSDEESNIRKRGREEPRGDDSISKKKKEFDREGNYNDVGSQSIKLPYTFGDDDDTDDSDSAPPPPSRPPPQLPAGNNAQDGDGFEDSDEVYDIEVVHPNIFKAVVVLKELKPKELKLLKRNNLSVIVSESGKLLSIRDGRTQMAIEPSSAFPGPSSAVAAQSSAINEPSSEITEPSSAVEDLIVPIPPDISGEITGPSTELQESGTDILQDQQQKSRRGVSLMDVDPLKWLLTNVTQYVKSLDHQKSEFKKPKPIKTDIAVVKIKNLVKVARKKPEKAENVNDFILTADPNCTDDEDNTEGGTDVPASATATSSSIPAVLSLPLSSTTEGVEVPGDPSPLLSLSTVVAPPLTRKRPSSMSYSDLQELDSYDSEQSDLEEIEESDDSSEEIQTLPASMEQDQQSTSKELIEQPPVPALPKKLVKPSTGPRPKLVTPKIWSSSSEESDSEEAISKRKVLRRTIAVKKGTSLRANKETISDSNLPDDESSTDLEKIEKEIPDTKSVADEEITQVLENKNEGEITQVLENVNEGETTQVLEKSNEREIISNGVPADVNEAEIIVNPVAVCGSNGGSIPLPENTNIPIPIAANANVEEIVSNAVVVPAVPDGLVISIAETNKEVVAGVNAESSTTEPTNVEGPSSKTNTDGKAEDSDDDCVVVHSVKSTKGQMILLETGGLSAADFLIRKRLAAEEAKATAAAAAAAAKRARRYTSAPSTSSVSFLGFFPNSKSGRKEIRPIKEERAAETTQAERKEKARLKALDESQKLQEELAIEKAARGIVLEFDLETKEPLISVEKALSDKLHVHQEEGVRFIWSSCFGTAKDLTESGCILAHLMGLGKSLTTLALIHTVISHPQILNIRTALVLCPLGVVSNWKKECDQWLTETDVKIPVFMLWGGKGLKRRAMKEWNRQGGIALLHYNAAAACINGKLDEAETEEGSEVVENVAEAESRRRIMKQILLKSDILVCDEGHQLKTPNTGFNRAVTLFKTKRRIILTGTPLQNNLKEYYNMINLIKPSLLGSPSEFANGFENPIKNGLHTDSLDKDVELMKRRTYILNEKLRGCVQRKNYDVLTQFLKPKHEYALFVTLSQLQTKLYSKYMKTFCDDRPGEGRKNQRLWTHYHILQKVSTHPKLLYCTEYSERKSNREFKPKTRVLDGEEEEEEEVVANDNEEDDIPIDPTWYQDIIPTEKRQMVANEWGQSGKLILLKEIIHACHELGDKLLIFSKFTYTLNIIEEFIKDHCDGSWELGESYFRIDGTIQTKKRDQFCEDFNSSKTARLFLLTTKSGGLGINLCGANRVVLFDVSMNPTDDCQSVFRVYRLGQEKECFVYRFVTDGGMEETTYKRSVLKLGLAKRVVDERQVERHFVMNESNDMYRFIPPSEPRVHPTQPVPSDSIMKKLLESHSKFISHHVEQDSLLMGERDLDEDEKTYARAEVISKPTAQRKPNEKKQQAPVKPGPSETGPSKPDPVKTRRPRKGPAKDKSPPVPDQVSQISKYSAPRCAGLMSSQDFGNIVYQSLSVFYPDLVPKDILELLLSVRDNLDLVTSLGASLNDNNASSFHKKQLAIRLESAYEELSSILGTAAAERTALLSTKNAKKAKPKPTATKARGRPKKSNSEWIEMGSKTATPRGTEGEKGSSPGPSGTTKSTGPGPSSTASLTSPNPSMTAEARPGVRSTLDSVWIEVGARAAGPSRPDEVTSDLCQVTVPRLISDPTSSVIIRSPGSQNRGPRKSKAVDDDGNSTPAKQTRVRSRTPRASRNSASKAAPQRRRR